MKLKMINPDNDFGFDTIEILQFNYDGKGNAIALGNGEPEPMALSVEDVDYIMFGDGNDQFYSVIK
jgi:hypothetical protein